MSMAETSATSFDNMCDIILQANDDPKMGVYWEQSPEWPFALTIAMDRQGDHDRSIVTSAFEDMLEVFDLTDLGFESYSQIYDLYLSVG